jgi:hypothetical protein
MLGTIGKIVGLVDDQDSFVSACDTTSQVTSNINQMPTENQEFGSKVMASMGDKMKDFKTNNTEIVINIAGSMLDTVSNVLVAATGSLPVANTTNSLIDSFLVNYF